TYHGVSETSVILPEAQTYHSHPHQGSVLCWVGTTAYDLYPLSAKYERSWMPLFPEIDCQEKLWSRVFLIERSSQSFHCFDGRVVLGSMNVRITGRTTTCTASVRRCCKGYLRIRTCDSQCKPAQQVVLPYCVRVKELLPLCPTKRLIFSNLHHIFI
ncbi:hypothetical protein HID58_047880, partial [Brassica napus]